MKPSNSCFPDKFYLATLYCVLGLFILKLTPAFCASQLQFQVVKQRLFSESKTPSLLFKCSKKQKQNKQQKKKKLKPLLKEIKQKS